MDDSFATRRAHSVASLVSFTVARLSFLIGMTNLSHNTPPFVNGKLLEYVVTKSATNTVKGLLTPQILHRQRKQEHGKTEQNQVEGDREKMGHSGYCAFSCSCRS